MAQVTETQTRVWLAKFERRTEASLREQTKVYIEAINRATGKQLKLRADEGR